MIRRPSPLLRFLGDYAFELCVVLAVIITLCAGCKHPTHSGELRYPLVVISESAGKEHSNVLREECPCITVLTADGYHFTDCCYGWVNTMTATYNVGDTIR